MLKRGGAIGSAIFFIIAPGAVAGLVPWLLAGWKSYGAIAIILASYFYKSL